MKGVRKVIIKDYTEYQVIDNRNYTLGVTYQCGPRRWQVCSGRFGYTNAPIVKSRRAALTLIKGET